MVSLKAKNPFGKDIELLSTKTWVGLGAFALVIGGLAVMTNWVINKSATVKSPIGNMWDRMSG